nr:APHP domain-containing protein [Planctomycetales bacterium]
NNITVEPLSVTLTPAADLQVTQLTVPERALVGQSIELSYTVANVGLGDTPLRQPAWDDLFYLSRDEFLDLSADRFLGFQRHEGGLAAGDSYQVMRTLNLPPDLTGPFTVFVVTDPVRGRDGTRGEVFEGQHENNNATGSSVPLIIELPPPSDLQIEDMVVPGSAQSGDPINITWTVRNQGEFPASGSWSDAVYLSADALWDIGDIPLGRVGFSGTLQPGDDGPGEAYTSTLTTTLPPARPGAYRIIVRTDIFNQVFEEEGEANNRAPSAGTLDVTVDPLQLGVPLPLSLSSGEDRLFQVRVGLGQTLRIRLQTDASSAANELFLRFGDVPDGILFDARSEGALLAEPVAVVPATQPGDYFLLVRSQNQPAANTPATLLAELVPFQITNVSPDAGGDSRYVTTTIRGAQFHENALVKLVRPGIAEFEPVRFQVIDATKIVAIFDFRDAPHGLYDLKVINPDGAEAIVPYRYLIERAIEPDVTIGLGGPRVLAPGDVGTYNVALQSLTNVDTPYTFFSFGIPELGTNPLVMNLKYVAFASNLRGGPANGSLEDVPFASLDSAVNTDRLPGEILAPGYLLDFAARDFTSLTFNAHTYPGLREILDGAFESLVTRIESLYPEFRGLVQTPEDLDQIQPGLFQIFETRANPLADVEDGDVAFKFHIAAASTALTRDEFVARQTDEALDLRTAILSDPSASQALVVLAADADQWVALYLA